MRDLTDSPHASGLDITLSHTLPEVIAHVARRHGVRPFIIDEAGGCLSFAGFAAAVRQLASALVAHGLAHGDRVAIWAPNSAQWILAAAATESIGAIMVPINTRFKGPEAAFVLAKTRARLLFTVSGFLGQDYAAMLVAACGGPGDGRPAQDLPQLEQIIPLDTPALGTFSQLQAEPALLAARMAAVTPATIADILFTSGTTGQPKGAMHNHGQALWMPAIWNMANDLRAGERMAIVNPFFHSFGYRSGWVSALIAGITIYPLASFDAGALLALIAREKISVLMGPPTLFQGLMEHADFATTDLSSLRVGHTGAAKVPVELIRAGHEVFGFELFLTSFGQTESTALVSVNYPGADAQTIATTVGRPLPGVELRIIDSQGQPLPPGESGELLVRGPNVMQGYFEEPEQTAAAIDAEGWLHTGDVGLIDAAGNLRILDRLKDVVIVGGFNAYPAEIEAVLRTHPAIADVCVIAWPDARMGEVCAACVVPRAGMALDLAALSAWCRERMANYKVPRHLFLVPAFPRTPLGKVQKFLLRDQVKALAGT
ncbi:MAG TPA: AMP-binding protein [Novosphingobium sp.]|nr:AMP-binding protein [Novosphingobium sp.]